MACGNFSAMGLQDETWLVTGSAGRIGRHLVRGLRGVVGSLALLDLHDSDVEGLPCAGVDVRDSTALAATLRGVDGVVHLAGIPDEADFDDLLASNVIGTRNVLEGARLNGVRRVVLASSNRVTGFTSIDEHIGVSAPVRPDGFYGVSKVACEALGRLYADKFGLEVVAVRIGSFNEVPGDVRMLSTWLSPRDGVSALVAAMTAPITGYAAFYAVSRNTRRWWDLADGAALGYQPVDDAEEYAPQFADGDVPNGVQGGSFADVEFSLSKQRRAAG